MSSHRQTLRLLWTTLALQTTLALAAASALAQAPLGNLQRGIVRGTAVQGAPPGLAAILLQEQSAEGSLLALVCSGVLIAPDVVLTAGHCIAHSAPERAAAGVERAWFVSFADDLRGVSEPPLHLPEDAVPVRATLLHPEYSVRENQRVGLGPSHDVGLVFLDAPVAGRAPSELAPDGFAAELLTGTDAVIAGYGWQSVEGAAGAWSDRAGRRAHGNSKVLEVGSHELRVGRPLAPQSEQERSLADLCEADSGGPVLIAWKDALVLAAIISRGYDADERCDNAGVSLRLDAVRPWIVAHAGLMDPDRASDAASCAAWGGSKKKPMWNTLAGLLALLVARFATRRRNLRRKVASCSTR